MKNLVLNYIGGVDEVGRGPLAGPVVAASIVFNKDYVNPAVKDSKQLSKKKRVKMAKEIVNSAKELRVVCIGQRVIEKINIKNSAYAAMYLAAKGTKADIYFFDGLYAPKSLPAKAIVKGDRTVFQISAASILAKVWRDSLMDELSLFYPDYGFKRNSGYPTFLHKEAIKSVGISPLHRETFNGVRGSKNYIYLGEQYFNIPTYLKRFIYGEDVIFVSKDSYQVFLQTSFKESLKNGGILIKGWESIKKVVKEEVNWESR
ncbi:MAG: ribonuclease HII [Candidatus Dadabacteria bacterium]|nr:MAG: ribonuclease HII [Candidatus Dadabacteria bacterium]